MWRKLLRSLLGCAIGAVVAGCIITKWVAYDSVSYMPWDRVVQRLLQPEWDTIAYVSTLVFATMVGIGLPLSYVLSRYGFSAVWWHVLAALSAMFVILTLFGLTFGAGLNPLIFTEFYVSTGLAVVLFWLIRRPDKDTTIAA